VAQKTSAEKFLPPRMNLRALREAAQHCRGCDLYKNATQVVFGEGPRRASLMLLGEVPGDEEDKQGHPFVGPAGRLLDDVLDEVGLDRDDVFVTNAVKHFRWEPRGTRRLHKKPSWRQIEACKPWLHAEILVVKPEGIVCLGATAAQTMLGRDFRITRQRGKFFKIDAGNRQLFLPGAGSAWLMATYHPSAILRAPEKAGRDRMRAEFTEDLHHAVERLEAPLPASR
jgi:DNA polymerase